jgi:hypothetical protein
LSRIGERGDLDDDVDPAPLQAGADHASRLQLQRGQRARQPQGDVEMAVIDRARLHADDEGVAANLRAPEPGHAADHRMQQDRRNSL